MNSKLNMYAGAFLGTVFVVMTVGLVADAVFHSEAPEEQGFAIQVAEGMGGGEGEGAAEEEGIEPIAPLMADADPSAGESGFRKCASCHTIEEGGANKVGPNLWGIVGGPVTHKEDYDYSSALVEFAADGTEWTYEHLSGFLHDPKGYVPGTKMGFAGISDAQDRADMIAYLRSMGSEDYALPDPNAAPEGATAEAGEGDASATQDAPGDEAEATAEEQPAADDGAAADGEAENQPADEGGAAATGAEEPAAEEPAAEEDAASGDEAAASGDEEEQVAEAATEETASGDAAASGFASMVASADPADGESTFRRCQACHSIEEGGANKVGPNLWNVVGGPVAGNEDYSYSSAMKEHAQERPTWDYDHLSSYLEAPRDVVPGTKMSFAGLKDEEDRAAVVAYMREMANEPAPLP